MSAASINPACVTTGGSDMTTARFRVTYDITTPESAEQGDYAESGFAHPGGWKYPATDPGPHEMTLREAIRTAGGGFEDCGRWWSTTDPSQNYRTGEDTYYSIHPPRDITPASYRRITRLLTGKDGR
jgi:hypothetical protein